MHGSTRIILEQLQNKTLIQKCLCHLDPRGEVTSLTKCDLVTVVSAVEVLQPRRLPCWEREEEVEEEQFIRNHFREDAIKVDLRNPQAIDCRSGKAAGHSHCRQGTAGPDRTP